MTKFCKENLMNAIVTEKRCTVCKDKKPVTDFYSTSKGVPKPECKICSKLYSKSWSEDNQNKKKQGARNWRIENPDYNHEWQKNHPKNGYERLKKWLNENIEKHHENNRNRRARIKGSGGKITAKEWRCLCDKYGNICLCCKKPDAKLTLDHIVPLSKGGLHKIENAQPLCRSCNSKKGTKTIDYRS